MRRERVVDERWHYGQPADRALITRFRDAGTERAMVRPPTAKTEPEVATVLERIAEVVLR